MDGLSSLHNEKKRRKTLLCLMHCFLTELNEILQLVIHINRNFKQQNFGNYSLQSTYKFTNLFQLNIGYFFAIVPHLLIFQRH